MAKHFGTDHHDEVIKPDVVGLVEGLIGYLDEPMADVSIFPTYLVSKLARRDVKVVLSGDGADELFAGYDWYLAERYARHYGRLPELLRTRVIPKAMDLVESASELPIAVPLTMLSKGAESPSFRYTLFAWSKFPTTTSRSPSPSTSPSAMESVESVSEPPTAVPVEGRFA